MRAGLLALLCLAAPSLAAAASDVMLFRLFLTDGTSVVSYGEFARVGDHVVFSMVAGGGAEPRLHTAMLPAAAIDWARTDQHAVSTRYQWYAPARGEEDFQRLSDEVAGVLNEVLQTTDRRRALEVAQQARATLAEWPRAHYGYRQRDVGEILSLLDEVISDLRAAAGMTTFEVALVAATPDVVLEPLVSMPSLREQIDQAFRVARLTERSPERVDLLQAALLLLEEADGALPSAEVADLRKLARTRIRDEQVIDARYSDVSRRLMTDATRGAERGRVGDVERALARISREDERLGHRRPEMVEALYTSVQAQLDAARRLRLQRDQWAIQVSLYRSYQLSLGDDLTQIVASQPALEAIRRLDGPAPEALVTLQARLRGGADRLDRVRPPTDLHVTHELLVGAWRLAENAVDGRYQAARAGSVNTAWEASSAAAGALLLLSRFQQEIRDLLEPPRVQ